MATKTVVEKRKVEVCDLCDGEISKGYTDEESGKRFDTVTCKNFFIFKTPERWAEYRKEQRGEEVQTEE